MDEGINVLSLFDGMSCGQIALERAGIKVKNYFASEIDKYAIKVTQSNYPNTIQLGDVTKVDSSNLPKIDLLIGGSPCQGFSFAGKQLNFEDVRSKLFFEYVRLLKELNPRYFLLENVRMKKESKDIISEYLGFEPIEINSALVSAQNRKRLYWTNIPNVEQPEDNGIFLKDIIENGLIDRDKSYCVDANYFKRGNLKSNFSDCRRQLVFEKPHGWNKGGVQEKDKFGSLRECTNGNYAVYDSQRCVQTGEADLNGFDCIKRTYDISGKCPTLTTMTGGHREPKITLSEMKWRKLTPIECERLQTVPDNYTNYVSNAQRYKMLGNGWTVNVIVHIFKNIEI